MKFFVKLATCSSLFLGLLIPLESSATNGAWLIGFGAKSRAMGGTGVAMNTGGMAAAFNPATMIDSGTRFDIGAELFIPPRAIYHESTTLGFTDERSNHDIFLIPSMGGTWAWKEDITLGFAFIGAGLQTEFDQTVNNSSCKKANAANPNSCPPTVFNVLDNLASNEAGVQLVQMQIVPSIAYKIDKTHTVGASFVMAAQFFRSEGLEDFAELQYTSSGGSEGLTGEGFSHSFGAGYRLGWLGKFMDEKLRVGANYSSRVWMNHFARYKNLFAENGDFDIPENYSVGLAYDFLPKWTVAFDVQRINWSDVASIGNPGPNADASKNPFDLCPEPTDITPCKLGGRLGLGFGWKNQTVYKLGVDWGYNEKWNLRAGWNYGKAPIPEDQILFNFLAPATPEHHLTLGAGYKIAEGWDLDMNFVYAFNNTIKGPTRYGIGGAVVTGANASISMRQITLGATLGIKF